MFWEMDGTAEAEVFKQTIEPAGLWIPVDLPSLIQNVYITPTELWLAAVIRDITAKYDLQVPVIQSGLAESPLY